MSAANYLEQFRTEKMKDKCQNTVNAYISDSKQFISFLGKDLENVTTEDINSYREQLIRQKLKPVTVNRKLVSIRKFIDYLNSNTEIRIFVEIKLIRVQKQDYLEEVLTKNDFDRIVAAAENVKDTRAIAVLYGLYLTGARVSELLQWKVKDITSDTINVRGKGGKYRDLFRSESLKQYLLDYIGSREAGEDEYIFLNSRNNNPMDRLAVHKLIKRYAGKAKIRLTRAHAHNFRHLCAFRLLEEGLSLDEVADILGHSDINTTRIYTRKTKVELMKAINKLS